MKLPTLLPADLGRCSIQILVLGFLLLFVPPSGAQDSRTSTATSAGTALSTGASSPGVGRRCSAPTRNLAGWWQRTALGRGTSEGWQVVERDLTFPPEAISLEVNLFLWLATGRVLFDDVTLTRIE